MPSSHAASVAALSTCVGLSEGFDSVLFNVVVFFSLIVMYDAAGLRRAAGRQATLLNRILHEHIQLPGPPQDRLRELLGHTPLEVLVGAVIGVLFSIALFRPPGGP
jgi:acid phosphatase family membrane protein YuiD